MSDKPKTIIRASFPRVVFEDVPLDELAFDLIKSFDATGIEFIPARLLQVDQTNDEIITTEGKYKFDFLILAAGARHAYELLPGGYEFAKSICDPSRILETKKAILDFREGNCYSGASAGFTPCDGPPLEMIMGLDYRLRKLDLRHKASLNFITDKDNLLPPGGPKTWAYLETVFKNRQIIAHLKVELEKLDREFLHFSDGSKKSYDLALLIPPYRGIKELEDSGLTDERGFIPVLSTTMRARKSEHYNIYAAGDAAAIPGPKQGHLALIQAGVAAAHIAWRINKKGQVPSYLPEFKCVMYLGGARGLYIYSQWLADGDVEEVKAGRKQELSKIKFEKLFFARRGNIGELHRKMMK